MIRQTIVILLFASFMVGCNAQNRAVDECIVGLEQSLKDIGPEKTLHISSLDCFEWDHLLLIAPSFSRKLIEDSLKIALPREINYSWVYDNEGRGWWMVFLNEKQVRQYLFIERTDLDFSTLLYKIGKGKDFMLINRSESQFETFHTGSLFSHTREPVIDVRMIKSLDNQGATDPKD